MRFRLATVTMVAILGSGLLTVPAMAHDTALGCRAPGRCVRTGRNPHWRDGAVGRAPLANRPGPG